MELKDAVETLAKSVAEDYPDIEKLSPNEQLYAIKLSIDGIDAACKDWQELVEAMITTFDLDRPIVDKLAKGTLKVCRESDQEMLAQVHEALKLDTYDSGPANAAFKSDPLVQLIEDFEAYAKRQGAILEEY